MSNYHLKIAYTVDNQNFETASPLEIKVQVEKKKKKISNLGLRENLILEVRLGTCILNEHVQHLFAICQQISLKFGFREKAA